jgi:hypothetical protein
MVHARVPRAAATMPALTADALASHIHQLRTHGGADNRLVVASRDYYLIVSARPDDPVLHLEAVANPNLTAAAALTPGRLEQLKQRGFRERPHHHNLFRKLSITDDAELTRLVDDLMTIFARAYGVDPGEPAVLDLQLGDGEPLQNPDIIRLMRALSVRRDWDARRALYAALLDATLLVPIDPEAATPDEPLEVERLGTFPVIAGFTDIDAMRMWNPRGLPYRPIPVADLVPRALALRVGSLLINPRGLVGGELYLNELESLDGALKRRASPV